jgi:hypothetical protein
MHCKKNFFTLVKCNYYLKMIHVEISNSKVENTLSVKYTSSFNLLEIYYLLLPNSDIVNSLRIVAVLFH